AELVRSRGPAAPGRTWPLSSTFQNCGTSRTWGTSGPPSPRATSASRRIPSSVLHWAEFLGVCARPFGRLLFYCRPVTPVTARLILEARGIKGPCAAPERWPTLETSPCSTLTQVLHSRRAHV